MLSNLACSTQLRSRAHLRPREITFSLTLAMAFGFGGPTTGRNQGCRPVVGPPNPKAMAKVRLNVISLACSTQLRSRAHLRPREITFSLTLAMAFGFGGPTTGRHP